MKKKVLIILNDLSGGGAERIFVNIANEFVAHGIQTDFLLGKKKGVYFDILRPDIKVIELNATSLYQYVRKLRVFLKKNDYTHIFTASDYVSVALVMAKRKLKFTAKVIATLHYNLPYQLSILPFATRTWMRYLNRSWISKADAIVAVSKGVADGYSGVAKAAAKKVQVIYNPVFDDSIFDRGKEPVTDTFFDRGKTTLITVGRMETQKNHKLMVDAFALLAAKRTDLQLLLIGRGSLEQSVREQIKQHNLEERFILTGFRQNPFAYIAKSDLFVLSSSYEGLPTVIIESLALGVNVVSTDCPSGPDEILSGGEFGWLTPPDNAEAFAVAIEQALAAKKPADKLLKRAMLFHKKNIIPQYLDLLN